MIWFQLWNGHLNNRYTNVCVCVFAAKWVFHTCGATGPIGPTPSQCSSSYHKSNVDVTVGTKGALKGIQMWRVPETGSYRYVLLRKITTSPYRHTNQWSDPIKHPIFIYNCSVMYICLLRFDLSVCTLGILGSQLMVQQVDVVFSTCSDHMESLLLEILGCRKMRCYTY